MLVNSPPFSPILVRAFMRNIVIPFCILPYFVSIYLSPFIKVPIYIFTPLIVYATHVGVRTLHNTRLAYERGATAIPTIRARTVPPRATLLQKLGAWILQLGNVDLMLAWDREGKEGYLGEGMVRRGVEDLGGTVNTRILGEDSMITIDPAIINQILTTSFTSFPKGEKFRERAVDFLGGGVFASDGAEWSFHRYSTRPFFTTSSKAFDTAHTLEPHTTRLLDIIFSRSTPTPSGSNSSKSNAIDVQALFLTYTMDVATDFLFGKCVNGLERWGARDGADVARARRGEDRREDLAKAFAEAQAVLAKRIKMGTPWSLFELIGNRMTSPQRKIKRFIRPIVEDAVRRKQQMGDGDGEGQCGRAGILLNHLVEVMGVKDIEDELINILLAARDTTASALTFCIYCMTMYPEMVNKMAAEVHSAFGGGRGDVTAGELKGLKYVNAFIMEVLRLYPPVPMNIRRSIEPVLLHPSSPSSPPLYMPAHTSIILSILLMQRSREVWGEDAEIFRPERWLEEGEAGAEAETGMRGKARARSRFVAFNAGPRTCLGQSFAMMHISYVLVRLLQRLGAEELDKSRLRMSSENLAPPAAWHNLLGRGREEKAWVSTSLTMFIKGGLWIEIDRDDR